MFKLLKYLRLKFEILHFLQVIYIPEIISSTKVDSPGWLTCLFPALMICRVHLPSTFSPQKCTLKNGQSSKLELTTSLGLSNKRVDVVPIGEVRSILKLPLGKNLRVTLHWTCSRKRTSFNVPRQALTSMDTVRALP